MTQQLIIQSARVVSTQKIDDRFLTVQKLNDEDFPKDKGDLFALVEITKPWFPISQIGSRILATFKNSYLEQDSSSDLVMFENSIKAVNEMLFKLTEQGETDWVGCLNSIILAAKNKEVHLAATGDVFAYLVREGGVSPILEKNNDQPQNSAKTFNSIISGSLLTNDTVIIASSETLNCLDKTKIKEAADQNSPYEAALELARELNKSNVKTVNLAVIKLIDKTLLKEEPEVVYIDRASEKLTAKILKWIKGKGFPTVKKIAAKSKSQLHSAHKIAKTKVYPKTKDTAQKISSKTHFLLKKTWSKARPFFKDKSSKINQKLDAVITGVKEKEAETKKDQKKKSQVLPNDPDVSIIGKSIYTIHDYQREKETAEMGKFSVFFAFFKKTGRKFYLSALQLLKTLLHPKKRPLLISILLIGFILILIASISYRRHNRQAQFITQKQSEALTLAKKNLEDGKTALVFGEKEQAQILFGRAISKSEGLLNTPLGKDAQPLLAEAQSQYDKLTGTTRVEQPKVVAKITDSYLIKVIANRGYVVSRSGKIYETGLSPNSTPEKKAELPEKTTVKYAAVDSKNNFLIYSSDQDIYIFDPRKNTLNKAKPEDGDKFSVASSLETFGTNIYLLDSGNNQIWKYLENKESYKAPKKFIPRSQINLKTAVDIAIDGSIYVLYKQGKVDRLTKGEKEDFHLSSVPKPFDKIKNPKRIYTNSDAPSLFIFDQEKRRLLEFDKNGQFLHQYILPVGFNSITDIAVQHKARSAFVLNKSVLYFVPLR